MKPVYLLLGFSLILGGCVQIKNADKIHTAEPVLDRTMVLPGVRGTRPTAGVPGRIDHGTYDPVTKRLFMAALENGSLEVVDLQTGGRIKSIPELDRPQGVAIASSVGCAVVACGGGKVYAFDTKTLKEVKSFELGAGADNVRYDATHDTVLVSHGNSDKGAIAVIDPHSWSVKSEFTFPSRPESFQLDLVGNRMFANLPRGVRAVTDGEVAVLNLKSGKVLARIPLKGQARNFPMAFDSAHQRLYIASRKPASLVQIDTRKYQISGEIYCTDDSDDLFYDAKRNRVYLIGGGFRPDLQEPGTASPYSPPGEMGGLDVFDIGPHGEMTRIYGVSTAPHARTGIYAVQRDALYIFAPIQGLLEAKILEYRPVE